MHIISKTGLGILLVGLSLSALAETQPGARSIGKQVGDSSIDLLSEVKSQPVVGGEVIGVTAGKSAVDTSSVANRIDQYFYIYDADVDMVADIDRDGFHHALNVTFDVDVDYGHATLYAKLYLSLEGGPWIQYTTSDLFDIFGDDAADAYQITTELVEGYNTGYYAVLIEIYSLHHTGMVASEVLDHHYLGRHTMLEDLSQDDVYVYEEVVVTSTYGTGSFSALFWLLIVQVVIAARRMVKPGSFSRYRALFIFSTR
ncbi:MAG: hypothetical protein GY784_01675 [Gammaproteobacteria bacterium]|nr:hypothetical protein [Gammaproteobacteria bacterium]